MNSATAAGATAARASSATVSRTREAARAGLSGIIFPITIALEAMSIGKLAAAITYPVATNRLLANHFSHPGCLLIAEAAGIPAAFLFGPLMAGEPVVAVLSRIKMV